MGEQHLKQCYLPFHPAGKLRKRAVQIDVKPLSESRQLGAVGKTAQPAQKANQLAAGHVLIEPQFPREIGDVFSGCDAVRPAIVLGDESAAGGRLQKPENQAKRGRFAGAVRPQEAEHLSCRDGHPEVVQGSMIAVILGQMFRSQKHINCWFSFV